MSGKQFHSFNEDDVLGCLDAVELAALVRKKEIDPSEIVEASINRATKLNEKLNCVHFERYEQARAESETPGPGFFAGLPSFVKDNTDYKGIPTQHGSQAIKGRPAPRHGAYTRQYLDQGFVILGKSSLPELSFNASTEYANDEPARNPWDPEYSCGASSGGSAILVAGGAVPIAHANDGGGSIRIPAACCGLVGLKPTRGRHVSGEMGKDLPIKIVSEGVLTRSVRDTAVFWHETEKYYRNKKLPEIGLVEHPGKKRRKIGLIMDSVTLHKTCDETRARVLQTASLLESLGHKVEEIALPFDKQFADDFRFYWGFLSFMSTKLGKKVFHGEFDENKLDGLSRGLAKEYGNKWLKTPGSFFRLNKIRKTYAKSFSKYDAVLSPVLSHTTPKLGYLKPDVPFEELMERLTNYVSFTPLNNVAGTPAISLPMGLTKQGLPLAIHLSGHFGDEKGLLELAFELEEAQPFPQIDN